MSSKQFSNIMTGNKDVDLKILSGLEDKDLLNFCLLANENRNINKLCNDYTFWRNRFIEKYNPSLQWIQKQNIKNWKRMYLKLSYYLNKTKEETSQIDDKNLMNWVLYCASKDGEYNIIDFLISKGVTDWVLGLRGAIESNNDYLIDFYHENDFGKYEYYSLLHFAVREGNKKLVDYYIGKGANNYNWAAYGAIEKNNLDMLKYVYDKMIGGIKNLPSEMLDDEISTNFKKYGMNQIVKFYIEERTRRYEEIKKQLRKRTKK